MNADICYTYSKYDLYYWCKVSFYNKKGIFKHYSLDINKFGDYLTIINRSSMIVFNVNPQKKQVVLNRLSRFCVLNNWYAPIIQVGENKIFFFPKLNYEDIYLIKNIIEDKYWDQNISAILGEIVI